MNEGGEAAGEQASLVACARLFGRLLLRELDAATLRELSEAPVAAALEDLELRLPTDEHQLEQSQAEYHRLFLSPRLQFPLVQSLWEGGQYDGPSARALRELASSAALDYDKERARGAPVDHLGAILLLWAELSESFPERAAILTRAHLDWARRPLARLAEEGGLYGELCARLLDFLPLLHAPDAPPPS